jgi:hypothetical protein
VTICIGALASTLDAALGQSARALVKRISASGGRLGCLQCCQFPFDSLVTLFLSSEQMGREVGSGAPRSPTAGRKRLPQAPGAAPAAVIPTSLAETPAPHEPHTPPLSTRRKSDVAEDGGAASPASAILAAALRKSQTGEVEGMHACV